jgi:hypothetical protein
MPATRNRGDVRARATTKNTVPMSHNKAAKAALSTHIKPPGVCQILILTDTSHGRRAARST